MKTFQKQKKKNHQTGGVTEQKSIIQMLLNQTHNMFPVPQIQFEDNVISHIYSPDKLTQFGKFRWK